MYRFSFSFPLVPVSSCALRANINAVVVNNWSIRGTKERERERESELSSRFKSISYRHKIWPVQTPPSPLHVLLGAEVRLLMARIWWELWEYYVLQNLLWLLWSSVLLLFYNPQQFVIVVVLLLVPFTLAYFKSQSKKNYLIIVSKLIVLIILVYIIIIEIMSTLYIDIL